MKELTTRFKNNKDPDRSSDEEKLVRLRKEFHEMQTTLNNYEANGWEEWKLFKERFENELTEQHELLINLIIKRSNSLNNDKSIQSFVKK
jgi:hypothetical protein